MESIKAFVADHTTVVVSVIGFIIVVLLITTVAYCYKHASKKDLNEEELDKLIEEVNSKQEATTQ